MKRPLVLVFSYIAVAVVFFLVGMYAAGVSNPLNVLTGSTNIVGKVTAISPSSITITEDGGASKTISIDASTRVLSAPTLQTLGDITVGSAVAANAPGGRAEMIQIVAPAPQAN